MEDAVGPALPRHRRVGEKMRALIESKPRSTEPSRGATSCRLALGGDDPSRPWPRCSTSAGTRLEARHGGSSERSFRGSTAYEGMRPLRGIAEALGSRSMSRMPAMISDRARELSGDPTLRVAVERCVKRLRSRSLPRVGAASAAGPRRLQPPQTLGHSI